MTAQKILIVDDEPFNIDYLEQELSEELYTTISASSGQLALEMVRKESPDLILLDIMMPEMDGFTVLSRLKEDLSTSNIPVIIISAASSMDNVIKGIQIGADDYLPKPFEPLLLKARISSCLEKKRLRDLEAIYLKRLENEMDIARDIQSGFLPSEIPQTDGWEIGAYFKAAKEVAGDFYDFFFLPDGSLVVLVGDVCGKGVGAALFMTLFRSLIRVTCLTNSFQGPSDVENFPVAERLRKAIGVTNDYVAETHSEDNMFATLFIGIFSASGGKVTYVNCGNEPPLVKRIKDGQLLNLPPTGPVIGLFPSTDIGVEELVLQEGDLLVAYTDGIPDAINDENISFGITNVHQCINSQFISPAELCEMIKLAVSEHIGGADQFDDITLVAIKRKEEL